MRPRTTLVTLTLLFAASVADAGPPNILFIMTDDHAAHAISAYGSRINRTPNIDRLANQGALFTNCFVTNSICAPSRAVILTGKYSHRNGVTDNRVKFDGRQWTLPKHLQQAGYETAIVGKWHLKTTPTGFDYHNVLPGQGKYHDPDLLEMGRRTQRRGYVTDIVTDLSIEWLERRDTDKPFFLMSHHKAPHMPWEPDDKHASLYENEKIPEPETLNARHADHTSAIHNTEIRLANINFWMKWDNPAGLGEQAQLEWLYQRYLKDYLRTIASVDDNVGRLLDYLDDAGLAENTVVVYTSDQGFYLGDHGLFDKRFMYEHALRAPLLIRYPKMIRPGSVIDAMALNLDLAQTLAELAGAEAPPDCQGRSLVPLLEGRTPADWRMSFYYRYYETWLCPPHYGIRTKRYKLIYYHGLDADLQWELFDLEKDPGERHNVYHRPAYASTVIDLKNELADIQRRYGDQPAQ